MRRRTAIIVGSLFVVLLAAAFWLMRQGREFILSDPWAGVSPDACIIIETRDLQSFVNSLTTDKGVFGEIARIREFGSFTKKLNAIADNLNKEQYRNMLAAGKALISFYPGSTGKLNTVLTMAVSPEIDTKTLKQSLSGSGLNASDIKISGIESLALPHSGAADTLYIAVKSGLLLVSSTERGMIRSSGCISGGSDVRSTPELSRVLIASGQNEEKVFVVFKNLFGVTRALFADEGAAIADAVSGMAGAAGSDLFLSEDGVSLSGFAASGDTSSLINYIRKVPPSEFQTCRILPASTAYFLTVILRNDVPLPEIIKHKGIAGEMISMLKPFLADEFTTALVDIRKNKASDNGINLYELTNPVLAEKAFLSSSVPKETIWYTPDDQVKLPVYRVASPPGPGTPETQPDETFIAFYDNFLISGSSYLTVATVLYDNLLNHTLENDIGFRDFEGSLPSRAGCFFYCVPSRMIGFLEGKLEPGLMASLRQNRSSAGKMQAAGFQLSSSNDMVYSSISVRFREDAVVSSAAEWETLLDTTAAIKPFFFTNHLTGAREIFVQDYNNNIYLVNSAGRVLWKVALKERIEGNIFMIDFYRNGKLQLLFNTRNHLHLIDRNGNYVGRYPVKLRSPASGPLALFDYENNRNYRLVIPGEDRLVYSYEKTGNVVKGWTPFRTAGTVRTPASYFQASGKDYIAVSDDKSLYLLDRYGNKRVNFTEAVGIARGSSLKPGSGSGQYLVCTSDSGTVQHIYFDGKVKRFRIKDFSAEHRFDIFDIDADGADEYVFIDNGTLSLYDHTLRELFSHKLSSKEIRGPASFIFSPDNRKIGVLEAGRNLVYLFDKEGNIADGFPVTGASMFSIGRLSSGNTWNLIVGGPGRFLYNYKIEGK